MKDDVGRVRDGITLHPLVDRALTSVSATLRRDTRGAKGRVKEWDEGLDSGIKRMECCFLTKVVLFFNIRIHVHINAF